MGPFKLTCFCLNKDNIVSLFLCQVCSVTICVFPALKCLSSVYKCMVNIT